MSTVVTPSNKRLHRLTREAGSYLGLAIGEPLPTEEVVAQAEANGYVEREVRTLLAEEGYASTESIPVPPQGDAFGELWQVEGSDTKAPNPASPILESFCEWCEDKRQMRRQEYDDGEYQHPVEHAYSYKSELQKFVRVKDVERWFIEEYDTFTTVLLTYTRPRSSDESVVEHAQEIPSRRIKRKHRECIKATGYWDEYAGVSLLAPKDVAPTPTAQATHGHGFDLIPGFVSSECFDSLRKIDGVDVSIQYHRSDKVSTPSAINEQELEQERGATTALAQEVGANLPVLTAIDSFRDKVQEETFINSARYKATLDATHCPEYVTRWCAHMSCGKDGKPDSNGIQRWTPLGRFKEIADSMKGEREYGAMGIGARDSSSAESNTSESCEGRVRATKTHLRRANSLLQVVETTKSQ